MTLEPLLTASFAIRLHVATVMPAALIGAWLLWARKGTLIHRLLGRVWIGLMVITSLSTFFIHEIRLIGAFSPIHFLSVMVIFSSFQAVRAARNRDFVAHSKNVKAMYVGGILAAGLFTFLPGRIMNEIIFNPAARGLGEAMSLASFLALMTGMTLFLLAFARLSTMRRA